MLLESLFLKEIALIIDNHVVIAIFCNFDKTKNQKCSSNRHIDILRHFVINYILTVIHLYFRNKNIDLYLQPLLDVLLK